MNGRFYAKDIATPEQAFNCLLLSVVRQAVSDLENKRHRKQAREFLESPAVVDLAIHFACDHMLAEVLNVV